MPSQVYYIVYGPTECIHTAATPPPCHGVAYVLACRQGQLGSLQRFGAGSLHNAMAAFRCVACRRQSCRGAFVGVLAVSFVALPTAAPSKAFYAAFDGLDGGNPCRRQFVAAEGGNRAFDSLSTLRRPAVGEVAPRWLPCRRDCLFDEPQPRCRLSEAAPYHRQGPAGSGAGLVGAFGLGIGRCRGAAVAQCCIWWSGTPRRNA